MNVTCPNCASMFRVDPSKVPEGGVRARCNICSAVFAVRREGDAQDRPAAVAGGGAGAGARPMTSATAPPTAAAPSAAMPSASPSPAPVPPPSPPPHAPVMPRAEPTRPTPPAAPARTGMPSAPAAAPSAAPRPASFPPPAVPTGAPRPSTPGGPGAPAAPAAHRPMGTPAAPPPPAPAPPRPAPTTGSRPVNPFLSQDPALKARRLARALISDMVVYHPTKRQDGLRDGNLKELFEEEIRKSWEEYADQVGKDVADSTPYFKEALNEILAGGRQIF